MASVKDIADMRGLSGPLAFAFDTKSKPGAIIVHSIRFETTEIPSENFEDIRFTMLSNDRRVDVLASCIIK